MNVSHSQALYLGTSQAPSIGLVGPSSLDDLKKGSQTDGDCGSDPTQPPPWLDMARYSKVVAFFEKHTMSLTLIWHCSLVIGFSLPSLLTAVDFTHVSDTPKKALQRYMRTFDALVLWHTGNIWDSSSKSYASVQDTRGMHKAVRSNMKVHLPGTTWISMYDMATVQTGFMGATTLMPTKFGIHVTAEELEDYVFFWKCVGHQLGLEDQYNLCSLGKVTSDKIVNEVISQVLLPDIANPPEQYSKTAEAYIDGLNLLFLGLKVFSVKSSLAMTFWALGLHYESLGALDICRFFLLRLMVKLAGWLPFLRSLFNWAIVSSVRRNRPFYAAHPTTVVCPFTGKSHSSRSLGFESAPSDADGKLRSCTPIGIMFLGFLLSLLCIAVAAVIMAAKLVVFLACSASVHNFLFNYAHFWHEGDK